MRVFFCFAFSFSCGRGSEQEERHAEEETLQMTKIKE